MAGAEGFEPSARGFGGHYATLLKGYIIASNAIPSILTPQFTTVSDN